MKYRSVFDIIGPIMIGPSSSHTAGAARIGLFARNIYKYEPKNIQITLYGSFKDTYMGHGTDIALIGGLLGYDTYDKRIRTSLIDAKKKGIVFKFIESDIEQVHPNTAKIELEGDGGYLEVLGKSIGGGKMIIFELQGFDLDVSADFTTIFIFFESNQDNINKLKQIMEENNVINYKFSSSIIEGKGLLTVEVNNIEEKFLKLINSIPYVKSVKFTPNI